MKNVKLCFEHNGTQMELPINVDEEILRKMFADMNDGSNSPKTGYERVDVNETYYRLDCFGMPEELTDYGDCDDLAAFEMGNYFNTEEVAYERSKEYILWMRIRAYAEKMGYVANKEDSGKFSIYFDTDLKAVSAAEIPYDTCLDFGVVYFKDANAANDVLCMFENELNEYFRGRK